MSEPIEIMGGQHGFPSRIAFDMDGNDVSLVYLTKREDGRLEITAAGDVPESKDVSITYVLTKAQADALREWLGQ